MSEFVDKILKLIGLTAGGIGAAGLGLALASDDLGLGIIMFIIFLIGSLFISNAAEIAAGVFAIEALFFWILAKGLEPSITKGDSIFAVVFFIIAIVILVFRRSV